MQDDWIDKDNEPDVNLEDFDWNSDWDFDLADFPETEALISSLTIFQLGMQMTRYSWVRVLNKILETACK